jgi:hypothetical protein
MSEVYSACIDMNENSKYRKEKRTYRESINLPTRQSRLIYVTWIKQQAISNIIYILSEEIRGGPGSNPGLLMWNFVMNKSDSGAGFPPRTSVSPANVHSICFSTIIFTTTRGWHNRPGMAAVPIASQTK